MIHTMFAMIKQQVGHRNGEKETVDDAVHHFVTAMTFFPQLLRAQTIKHVQALAALALFARNYQKPEAAWFIIHPAVWATVERGLNRSASTLAEEQRRKLSPHDIEMRKRIFWVIFSIATAVSGRLGRPLPLRMQDIDVEFPEPIPDALPEEANLTDIEKCSFLVSIVGTKLIALMAQLYSNCFAVRRNSQTYEADLAQLEREHQIWQKNLPPELANPSNAPTSIRIPSIYCRLWDLEFQFFLHHPVLNNQPHYNTANLMKSLDVCEQFLPLIDELRAAQCIDSQWVFVSLLLAVIFTILFVYDVRGKEVTEEELKKLQTDMHMWQVILAEIGELQGMIALLVPSSTIY
jgi:Fungal specific transcription factor domain